MDSSQSYINGDNKDAITLTSFHTNPIKRRLILRIHITSMKEVRYMFIGIPGRIHISVTIRESHNFNRVSHSNIHGKAHNTSKDGAYTAHV